jgi:hypothetical protein
VGQLSRQKLARRIVQGKGATLPTDEPWTPLEIATGRDGSRQCFDGTDYFDIWKNSRYTVFKRVVKSSNPDDPELIHLSIKRNDKRPVTSWRDLQKIKNELVGPECEAVQIFPAESRMIDTSNQYHLWCFSDPTFRIPFGYNERLVYEGNSHGAIQEPFEDHVKPKDLVSQEQMDEAHRRFKEGFNQG